LASHWYSQSQYQKAIVEVKEMHDENLRTYALKAAEKVTNLSNELNRLSAYLEEELEDGETRTNEIALLSAHERITSAIHIVYTLRSVNDTALSDWQGVIGDQLDKQREEMREKQEQLREIILETVDVLKQGDENASIKSSGTDELHNTLRSLNSELKFAIKQISGVSVNTRPPRRPGRDVIMTNCPQCQAELTYKQRPIKNGTKLVKCNSCGSSMISVYDGDEFIFEQRRPVEIEVSCPNCSATQKLKLDNAPGAVIDCQCQVCNEVMRVSRSSAIQKIHTKILRKTSLPESLSGAKEANNQSVVVAPILDDKLLTLVKESLPEQPWPIGIHKDVATKLNISHSISYRAISLLIEKGAFLPQISGVVYVPKVNLREVQSPNEKTSAS